MKILITLSLLFIGLTTFAQNVSMTIFNNSGQQFFVVMNGIRQNSLPQTNVKIGGMTTGSYEIKLIFADGKTGDINKKIYVDAAGNYLARVVFKGKKSKLQYFGVTDNNQMPAGGTDIQYRPNDQSVYSDQSVGLNTNGQSGTVNQSGQNTQGSGQSTTLQSGTVGTTTTIPDPNIPNGTQTTTTTSGSQSGTIGSGTTVTDPNNPNGQMGMNININIQDPTMNGGVGGVSTSTSTSGTGTGNGGMSTTTTVSDPNNPNGNFGVNMNVSGTGLGNATSTTTTTSSSTITQNGQVVEDTYNYNQSTSVTQNGQTTTTTQSSQSGNNGQGAGSAQISMNGGNGTSASTQGNGTNTANGYSCTSVLVDGDAFVTRLKNETFDADKRAMIETELKMQCVSADQAYKIINGLTFPEDRLEMSKFLYDRMTDRVNGGRLVELLNFDMDKEEFQTYMKTKN